MAYAGVRLRHSACVALAALGALLFAPGAASASAIDSPQSSPSWSLRLSPPTGSNGRLAASRGSLWSVISDVQPVASDNFDRAPSPTLGDASTGGSWVAGSAWSIVGNHAVVNSQSPAVATLDSGSVNHVATAKVTAVTSFDVGLVCRYVDSDNYILFNVSRDNGNYPNAVGRIFRRDHGAFTPIGALFSFTAVVDSVLSLKMDCDGNTITGYVNGDQVDTATDTTPVGTRSGIVGMGNSTAMPFDDFTIGIPGNGDSGDPTSTPTPTVPPTNSGTTTVVFSDGWIPDAILGIAIAVGLALTLITIHVVGNWGMRNG